MSSDYLGHFAAEYSLLHNSVFSDQYRLSSDLPVSRRMLSAESPPDERIIFSCERVLERLERLRPR